MYVLNSDNSETQNLMLSLETSSVVALMLSSVEYYWVEIFIYPYNLHGIPSVIPNGHWLDRS